MYYPPMRSRSSVVATVSFGAAFISAASIYFYLFANNAESMAAFFVAPAIPSIIGWVALSSSKEANRVVQIVIGGVSASLTMNGIVAIAMFPILAGLRKDGAFDAAMAMITYGPLPLLVGGVVLYSSLSTEIAIRKERETKQ